MNKLEKSRIRTEFIIALGFFLFLIFFFLKMKLIAEIFIFTTLFLLLIEVFYSIFYVSKFKKNYIERNENVSENKNICEDLISKIKSYRFTEKISHIIFFILFPFAIVDILLGYYVFKEQLFEEVVEYMYFAYGLVTIFIFLGLKMAVKKVKQIKVLNTINDDVESKNYGYIKAKPSSIYPLYYGHFSRKNRICMGYGLEVVFADLRLVVLTEFPYIGKNRIYELINNNLLNEKYELRYLKNSGIVISGYGRFIRVLGE